MVAPFLESPVGEDSSDTVVSQYSAMRVHLGLFLSDSVATCWRMSPASQKHGQFW